MVEAFYSSPAVLVMKNRSPDCIFVRSHYANEVSDFNPHARDPSVYSDKLPVQGLTQILTDSAKIRADPYPNETLRFQFRNTEALSLYPIVLPLQYVVVICGFKNDEYPQLAI